VLVLMALRSNNMRAESGDVYEAHFPDGVAVGAYVEFGEAMEAEVVEILSIRTMQALSQPVDAGVVARVRLGNLRKAAPKMSLIDAMNESINMFRAADRGFGLFAQSMATPPESFVSLQSSVDLNSLKVPVADIMAKDIADMDAATYSRYRSLLDKLGRSGEV
jgi:hypothetical protein